MLHTLKFHVLYAAKEHALKRDSALKEIIEILKQVIQMDHYYLVIEKHSNAAVD